MKGVECDLNPVVVIEHLLTAREVRANLIGFVIKADCHDVEVLVVVAKIGVCPL